MQAPPLGELYDLLRAEGFAIGVDDHVRIGRLIARDGAWTIDTLQIAIASLIVKDPRERAAFDATWARWLSTNVPQPDVPQAVQSTAPPRRTWWIWMLLAAVIGAGMFALVRPRTRPAKKQEAVNSPQPIAIDAAIADAPIDAEVPSREIAAGEDRPASVDRTKLPGIKLPDVSTVETSPAEIVNTQSAAPPPARTGASSPWLTALAIAFGSSLALTALAIAGLVARRRRAFLPGPWRYRLALPPPKPALGRVAIEDAAADLTWQANVAGIDLDIDRTVARTVASGGMATLVYRRPPAVAEYVVLEDVAHGTERWRFLYDELLRGLAREGVSLARYRFDAVPDRCFTPDSRAVELRDIVEHADGLIVIGDGAAAIDGDGPAEWVEQLRQVPRRIWINPLPPARWTEGARFIARDTPMEHGVARALGGLRAGSRAELPPRPLPAIALRNPDSNVAIEALRAHLKHDAFAILCAVAIIGNPAIATARWIAERLDISLDERDWLHLTALPWFISERWPDGLRARLIATIEYDDRERAAQIRTFGDAVLRASEPPPNTGAHHAWELDAAVQRATHGDKRGAFLASARLASSPLADEARRRLGAIGLPDRRGRALVAATLLGAALITLGVEPFRPRAATIPPRLARTELVQPPAAKRALIEDISVEAADEDTAELRIGVQAFDLASLGKLLPITNPIRVSGLGEHAAATVASRKTSVVVFAQISVVRSLLVQDAYFMTFVGDPSRDTRCFTFGRDVAVCDKQNLDTVEDLGIPSLRYAVERGIRELARSRAPRRRLLIVADGRDDGVGPSLRSLASRAASLGIHIDTIAYTSETYDLPNLAELSNTSRGVFRWVHDKDELSVALTSLQQQLARETVVTIRTDLATLPTTLSVTVDGMQSAPVLVPGVTSYATATTRARDIVRIAALAVIAACLIEILRFLAPLFARRQR